MEAFAFGFALGARQGVGEDGAGGFRRRNIARWQANVGPLNLLADSCDLGRGGDLLRAAGVLHAKSLPDSVLKSNAASCPSDKVPPEFPNGSSSNVLMGVRRLET